MPIITDEKKVLLAQAISARLPRVRGFGYVANLLVKRFRSRNVMVPLQRFGKSFVLNSGEMIDFAVIFFPQHYDLQELKFLKEVLSEGNLFIDIGANIGVYTAVASDLVGPTGTVISVEASPVIFTKLNEFQSWM